MNEQWRIKNCNLQSGAVLWLRHSFARAFSSDSKNLAIRHCERPLGRVAINRQRIPIILALYTVDCFAYARNDKRQHEKNKDKGKIDKRNRKKKRTEKGRKRNKRKKNKGGEKERREKKNKKAKKKKHKRTTTAPQGGQWRMPKAQILYYWSSRMIFCCTEFA